MTIYRSDHIFDHFTLNITQPSFAFLRPYTTHDHKLQFNLLINHVSIRFYFHISRCEKGDQLSLYGRTGLLWVREEGLASIRDIVWVNMPGEEDAIQGNALVSFEARLQKQVEELIVCLNFIFRFLMILRLLERIQ